MSQSKYKGRRRSDRNARIIAITFSALVVLSVILGLVGPFTLQDPDEPTPIPTRVIPTAVPLATPTPTDSVPTPVLVTPTTGP